MYKKFLLLPLILSVSACANMQSTSGSHLVSSPKYHFMSELSASAQRATAAQERVAALQQAQEPTTALPVLPKHVHGPFGVRMAFHWDGTLNGGVRALAAYVGLKVVVVGRPPSVPVMVYVDNTHKSVIQNMYMMGLQAGDLAGVVPVPSRNEVKIVYGSKKVATTSLGGAQ